MQVLRTPEDRFAGLPDYAFPPNYAEVTTPDDPSAPSLRLHYLDEAGRNEVGEGSADGGATILLLHGEPSWSFLYRHMIPVLTAAGHRCIAPDLIGFGRSDKPASPEDYSYARHVEWIRQLVVDRLELSDITLVAQDWGGMIGLRLVAEHPDLFTRVVIANSGLPTGDEPSSDVLAAWQQFARETPELPVGGIVKGGCVADLAPEVVAAYDAPFPDESYKAGARQFPTLIPTTPDNPAAAANRAAWAALAEFRRPFLCAFSDRDPITAGADRRMLREIPGTDGQPHTTIEGAGHFLQEEQGPRLARVVADFIAGSPA